MRTPISEHHRLSSIDTLRGFALLGILVMNIQSFAMISAAYTFPNLHTDISGLNLVIWTLSHIFADLKFMAIFPCCLVQGLFWQHSDGIRRGSADGPIIMHARFGC